MNFFVKRSSARTLPHSWAWPSLSAAFVALTLLSCAGQSTPSQDERQVSASQASAEETSVHEAYLAEQQHSMEQGSAQTEAAAVDWKAISHAEWKEQLSPMAFNVLREAGTERSFSGEYWDEKRAGTYTCGGCQLPLFSSQTKFKSGTGWPSFWEPVSAASVGTDTDQKIGYTRTEVHCARCEGHLGHIFNDGPDPTGLRYCINSVSLDFEPN